MDPLKIRIMDVDNFINEHGLQEVTSSFIKTPSSSNFDPDGLFSEYIFGELASKDRVYRQGYISLHCKVIHPKLYKTIMELSSLYSDIVTGNTYVKFDEKINDFVMVDEEDESANTGYTYFIQNIARVVPNKTGMLRKDTKVEIFLSNKDRLFIDKIIVLPAGLREYKEVNGRGEYDDINKIYISIINICRAVSEKESDNSIFDPVLLSIQKKVCYLYDYIWNIVDGKNGYLQDKYSSRAIVLGTRNVISPSDTATIGVNDPSTLKSDEVLIPLYQFLNMFKPLILYKLKNEFFNNIFNKDTVQASLIDKKTLKLGYRTIPISEKSRFLTSDKISDMIKNFRDDLVKHSPVVVYSEEGEECYLYLTYRDGSNIYIIRSIDELHTLKESGYIKDIIKDNIKPLTYFEMFYIVAISTGKKYTTVTRYPVTSSNSIYPAKIHIATTVEYEYLTLVSHTNPDITVQYSRFPILNKDSVGSVTPHPSQLLSLGADFDGDTVSNIGILSEEATKECEDYLNSSSSLVNTNGTMITGLMGDFADLCNVTLHNLTRDID